MAEGTRMPADDGDPDLRATLDALRESEEKYRALFELSPESIVVLGLDGMILDCNPATEKLSGLSRAETVGRPFLELDVLKEEDLATYAELFAGVLAGTDVGPFEVEIVANDGQSRWLEVFPVLQQREGLPTAFQLISRDITERKSAEEALRQQNEYLAALHETTLGLLGRLGETDLLQAIIERAGSLLGTPHGYIHLLDPSEEEMVVQVGLGFYQPYVGQRFGPGEGLTGQVWQHGYLVTVNDYQTWPNRIADPAFDVLHAVVGVPLRSGSRLAGVLGLAHTREGKTFGEGEIETLTRFAQLASVALDNSRLYLTLEEQLAERQRVENSLRIERDLAFALSATIDLQGALDRVLEVILQLDEIDCAGVYLVDRSSGALDLVAYRGLCAQSVIGAPYYEADSSYACLVTLGEPIHAPYPAPVSQAEMQDLREQGLRAVFIIPVWYWGHVIASLNLGSYAYDEFSDRTRDAMEAIASQLGGFIARVTAEEALQESERKFRSIVEQSSDGVILIDEEGRVVEWNWSSERIFGLKRSEALGRFCWDVQHSLFPEETRQTPGLHERIKASFLAYLRTGQSDWTDGPVEQEIERHDGSRRLVQISIFAIETEKGFMAGIVSRDITEQRMMQRSLTQSARLAAAGRLAASIAHEINNPLQSVIGCLRLAQEELDEGGSADEYLQVAGDEIRRVSQTVSQMRDLYRPASLEKELGDVNVLVEQVLNLTRKQCHESGVDVTWDPADGLPMLFLVSDQIKQVFLNLLLNALEAMPEGGQLRVGTMATKQPAGVRIDFLDSGLGIAVDELPNIFDPFYSTKREGTGLGLSISYGIIERHGGSIEVDSRQGQGSRFSVWLPA